MGFLKEAKPAKMKWRTVCRGDELFEVRTPNGELYGTFPTLNQAASIVGRRQKEDDERARRMKRPCMCCGHAFMSEGIHNRMCDLCRHRDVAPDPVRQVAMTRHAG